MDDTNIGRSQRKSKIIGRWGGGWLEPHLTYSAGCLTADLGSTVHATYTFVCMAVGVLGVCSPLWGGCDYSHLSWKLFLLKPPVTLALWLSEHSHEEVASGQGPARGSQPSCCHWAWFISCVSPWATLQSYYQAVNPGL